MNIIIIINTRHLSILRLLHLLIPFLHILLIYLLALHTSNSSSTSSSTLPFPLPPLLFDWCALREALYKCINTIQYNTIQYFVPLFPPSAVCSAHSGDWLTELPITVFDLCIDNEVVRAADGLWLSLNLCHPLAMDQMVTPG